MWRSEERLAFWLSGGSLPPRPKRGAWIERLRLRNFKVEIKDLSLNNESRMVSLDDALSLGTDARDGLDALAEISSENDSPDRSGFWRSVPVRSVGPLGVAVVRKISMSEAHRTRIRQETLVMAPRMRSTAAELKPCIHALQSLQDQAAQVPDSTRLLLSNPSIRTTAQISELPHRRKSAEVGRLEDSERISFLREAEALKRVPSDRAELLAVFRHVPIEVISRLRFLADSKEILYTIQDEPKRTQIRVHDLAVIRDIASQEIHLMPHRTKFRSIHLT